MKFMKEKPTDLDRNCDQHGAYMAQAIDVLGKYMVRDFCPKCAEIQSIQAEENRAEHRKAKAAQELALRKNRAGLRSRHINCTLENYNAISDQQREALGKVSSFTSGLIDGSGGNLVLAGRVGTGKTHLAAGIISALVERGISCAIIKLPELIRSIKASWKSDGETENQIINRFSSYRLLIVDEVGVQYGSDTEKLLLSEIIDNRYQEGLPTVLVSNLDIQGIKTCIGERCYDRLKEDGGTVVAFDWESHRGSVPPIQHIYQPEKTTRRKPLPRPGDDS